jgi:hypothetical protein
MRKIFFVFAGLVLVSKIFAAPGDTTKINVYDRFHMDRFGNIDRWAQFQQKPQTSQRIWMKYTLGCLSNGQCEWDYTIKIFARQRTGVLDSTSQQAPSFRVDGAVKDTLYYSVDTTFQTIFNTGTSEIDLVPNAAMKIRLFNNPAQPLLATDSIMVWPVLYYQYLFDSTGAKLDSSLTLPTDTIYQSFRTVYTVFEVINDIEIGRFISPYAKSFPKSFQYDYWFDVTDYAPLLKDSTQIRIRYEGYSYGFTANIDFMFVEGVPVRDVVQVDNVYSGGFPYGRANNSIENFLPAKSFTVPQGTDIVKARIYITGHGMEQAENCAEFCAKRYFLKLNNQVVATQLVWKDDCGKNAIINQPGTWIYNRSNWCPGEKIPLYNYEFDLPVGSTNTIDLDMEAFIANGDASYNIALQLIYLKAPNYNTDIAIEDIIAPTTDFWHNRVNPICDNARVLVKNLGVDPVTDLSFSYKLGNAAAQTYTWNGTIQPNEEVHVTLPSLAWPSGGQNGIFEVEITKLGNGTDGNAFNNKRVSTYVIPLTLPRRFVIDVATNNRPEQNSYTIIGPDGRVVFERSFSTPTTFFRDTFELGLGCYQFNFDDRGGNGLSFWAQPSEGNGNVRILSAEMPVRLLRSFNMDFGSFIQQQFTVIYPVQVPDISQDVLQAVVYPNPASNQLYIETDLVNITLMLFDLNGQVVKQLPYTGKAIDIQDIQSGIYVLKISDELQRTRVQKLVITK